MRRSRGSPSKARPKAGYHHPGLRESLIREAMLLVEKHGVDAVTLRKLAAKLRVTHSAPYRHFASREALLAAVAEVGFGRLLQNGRQALASIVHPVGRTRAYGLVYIQFAAENPGVFQLMFKESGLDFRKFPALCDTSQASFQLLVKCIEECQAVGLMSAGESLYPALSAWAFVHGISMLLIDGRLTPPGQAAPVPNPADLWAGLSEHLFGGLLK